jgi:hypothetical protein
MSHTDRIAEVTRSIESLGDKAASRIATLTSRLSAAEQREREAVAYGLAMRKALVEARDSLQFANDSPGGGIDDTIWMMHGPQTLFDYMDAALDESPPQALYSLRQQILAEIIAELPQGLSGDDAIDAYQELAMRLAEQGEGKGEKE